LAKGKLLGFEQPFVKRKLIQLVGSVFSIEGRGIRWSACLLALVLAGAVPSFAKTLTVTNTNDRGSGSLRDTIAIANAGDTIEFGVTGTIMVTSAELTLIRASLSKGRAQPNWPSAAAGSSESSLSPAGRSLFPA
jgi:hypothetical protein